LQTGLDQFAKPYITPAATVKPARAFPVRSRPQTR